MEKFTKLQYNEVETKKVSDFETSFTIKPLERGFANTLGNAVRRVLLSSVTGVAPFAVKISNVNHEFQTIEGVKEDAVQLILNLKKVRFVYNPEVFTEGEVVKVSLSAKSGEVTASDFKLPAGIQIVNPSEKIATVAKTGTIEIEMFLISGRGFKSFEENKETVKELQNKLETSIKSGAVIAMDSDFSPVVNVSYESVELNTSSADIEEKLTINVKTDGSVEAKDAIAQAAHILMSHLQILSDVSNIGKDEIFQEVIEDSQENTVEAIAITSLDLSVRSYNCLKRSKIDTLDQLAELTMDELINIKNLGKKSVDEIIDKLAEYNITLKGGE